MTPASERECVTNQVVTAGTERARAERAAKSLVPLELLLLLLLLPLLLVWHHNYSCRIPLEFIFELIKDLESFSKMWLLLIVFVHYVPIIYLQTDVTDILLLLQALLL